MQRFLDIVALYDPRPAGLDAFRFAHSLSERIVAPFQVMVPALLEGLPANEQHNLYEWLRQRLPAPSRAAFPEDAVVMGHPVVEVFRHQLVVSNTLAAMRRDVDVLLPQCEREWGERNPEAPALIPFGNREAGRYAMTYGLPLVRRLGFTRVVFYHSTWKDENNPSEQLTDHMDEGAVQVLQDAVETAEQLGFEQECLVEAAPEVSDGIRRAAMRTGSRLVVLARGLTRHGCGYVDKVLNGFPVPTLVMGRCLREVN